jgi:hypothetical protein
MLTEISQRTINFRFFTANYGTTLHINVIADNDIFFLKECINEAWPA